MGVSEILATIDQEIAQLQQARALLTGVAAPVAKRKPGRPRKNDAVVTMAAAKPARKKRKLSPEGRKRIAEAVKKRWAVQKAAPTKAVAAPKKAAKKKRNLSPEGRKRIAEAAKKRWAAQKAVVAS